MVRKRGVEPHRLWFFPVVLGRDTRLFEAGAAPTALKLIDIPAHRRELDLSHTDFIAARSKFREHIAVLKRPEPPDG